MFPRLSIYLSNKGCIEFFASESFGFVRKVTNEIIQRRRQHLEVRNDFIQNMIEHQLDDEEVTTSSDSSSADGNCCYFDQNNNNIINNNNNNCNNKNKAALTNNEIISQSFLFMFAGYETASLTLAFIAYNLATHPECQSKLCKEVDDTLQQYVRENDLFLISGGLGKPIYSIL